MRIMENSFPDRTRMQGEDENEYINIDGALRDKAMLEQQIRQQRENHSCEVQALHEELRERLKLIRLLNSPDRQSTLNLTNSVTQDYAQLQEGNEMLTAELKEVMDKLNSSRSEIDMLKCDLKNSEENKERLLEQTNEMQRDFSMQMEKLENELNKYRDRELRFRDYKSDFETYIEKLENLIRILKGNNKSLKENIKKSYERNLDLQKITKKKTDDLNSLRGNLGRYRKLFKDLEEQTQRYGETISMLEERLDIQEKKLIRKKLLDHRALKHLGISNSILNEKLILLRKQHIAEMMIKEEKNRLLKQQLTECQEELDVKTKLLKETYCLLANANITIVELRNNVPRAAYERVENQLTNLQRKVSMFQNIMESSAIDEEDDGPLPIDAPLEVQKPPDDGSTVASQHNGENVELPSSREHINVLEQRISCLCIPRFSRSSWRCQGCTTRKASCTEETFTAESIIEQASTASANIPELDLSLVIQMKKSASDTSI